jgi:hypothetical protein
MAVGSGLSSTLGIATETTVGTPVAVTRFVEFNTESLQLKKTTVQGQGLRGGALVRRAQRRNYVARAAGGDINFDVPTSGFGLFLQHMLGSFTTTPTSLGGGVFQQVHNVASLQGKTFTTQVVKPDVTGVLAQQAFTYPGCKVTQWELSVQQAQQLQVKLTIDALDEATPGNVTSTALSALTAAGATSLTTPVTIPAGSYITVGTGLLAEVVVTGTPTGAGPFTIPVSPALTYGHAAAAYVGSATNIAYGAATALQAASYTASTSMWDFSEGTLVAGGSTSVVSNVWTNTGGVSLGVVRTVSITGSNKLKVDRWGLGSTVRAEQLENDFRDYNASFTVEYNSRQTYDTAAADAALALRLTFTHRNNGAIISVYAPLGFQDDSSSPQIGGPDITMENLSFTLLDDGTNGALQIVYTSTDAAV